MDDDTRSDPTSGDADGDRDADELPLPHDESRPSLQPAVTGPVGALAGAAAGAATGTLTVGPIGTIIGAIVGAVGGGWAGVATAASAQPSTDDELFYQESYRGATGLPPDARYEQVRPAFHLGQAAASNPDYRGRAFEEIEPDLRHGWTAEVGARHGDWADVRGYTRAAYLRAGERAQDVELPTRSRQATVPPSDDLRGTASHRRAEYNDPIIDADEAGLADRGSIDRSPSPPTQRPGSSDMEAR